jgi:hypothetical protein
MRASPKNALESLWLCSRKLLNALIEAGMQKKE